MSSTHTVTLNVRQRSTYLSAMCPDVPGLHVVGSTREELRRSAILGIKTLYKRNRGMDVEVLPTDDLSVLTVKTA